MPTRRLDGWPLPALRKTTDGVMAGCSAPPHHVLSQDPFVHAAAAADDDVDDRVVHDVVGNIFHCLGTETSVCEDVQVIRYENLYSPYNGSIIYNRKIEC